MASYHNFSDLCITTKNMSQPNTFAVFTVPTKTGEEDSAKKEVIDASLLTEEDLKILKKQDPFFYFSIPAAPAPAHLAREVDMSCSKGGTSLGASFPSQLKSASTTKVERKSCVSVERYPDLILERLIGDEDVWNMDTGDEFDIGPLLVQPRVQPPRNPEKQ